MPSCWLLWFLTCSFSTVFTFFLIHTCLIEHFNIATNYFSKLWWRSFHFSLVLSKFSSDIALCKNTDHIPKCVLQTWLEPVIYLCFLLHLSTGKNFIKCVLNLKIHLCLECLFHLYSLNNSLSSCKLNIKFHFAHSEFFCDSLPMLFDFGCHHNLVITSFASILYPKIVSIASIFVSFSSWGCTCCLYFCAHI
jgi:hypothetical protein